MEEKNIIINDFNRIAELKSSKWNHNMHYYNYLIRHIPNHCHKALEVGCGIGDFTRLLSKHCDYVQGMDISPKMIERAKEISNAYSNITYSLEDILEYKQREGEYDYIVTIATMHHLPLEEALFRLKYALKQKGTLIVLDLYQVSTISDILLACLATPINILYMLVKNGRIKSNKEEIEAWAEHSKHDKFMTLKEIKKVASKVLPGVKIKRHLFWRYSLIWNKELIEIGSFEWNYKKNTKVQGILDT